MNDVVTSTTESKHLARWRPRGVAAIAVAIVAASLLVVPRCLIDYGENGDAIDNATDAMRLAEHGLRESIPTMVRWPPGIPAFIYLLSALVPWGGHAASNLMVFAFYIGAVLIFRQMTKELPHRHWLLALFAFTPLLLRDSGVTQDFVPGTFFVMAAYLALERSRYSLAAILIGVATGFRITNILLLVPATLHVWIANVRHPVLVRLRTLGIMNVTAVGFGLAWYAPFIYYSGLGWRYFIPTRHGDVYLPGFVYNTVYIFGPIALVAIIAVALYERHNLVAYFQAGVAQSPRKVFVLTTLLVYTAICFRFPNKVSYYIPAIPFFYLFLADWVSAGALKVIAVAIASFSFVNLELKGGESGQRALDPHLTWGCVLDDWFRRDEIQELRKRVGQLRSLGKAVVLTGMGGILTRYNDQLVQVDSAAVSPSLDPSVGRGTYRITDNIFRVKESDVFLVANLSEPNVRLLRNEGYGVYMFSEYAPSGIRSSQGYDAYQAGIQILPVLTRCAFYRPKCEQH